MQPSTTLALQGARGGRFRLLLALWLLRGPYPLNVLVKVRSSVTDVHATFAAVIDDSAYVICDIRLTAAQSRHLLLGENVFLK